MLAFVRRLLVFCPVPKVVPSRQIIREVQDSKELLANNSRNLAKIDEDCAEIGQDKHKKMEKTMRIKGTGPDQRDEIVEFIRCHKEEIIKVKEVRNRKMTLKKLNKVSQNINSTGQKLRSRT